MLTLCVCVVYVCVLCMCVCSCACVDRCICTLKGKVKDDGNNFVISDRNISLQFSTNSVSLQMGHDTETLSLDIRQVIMLLTSMVYTRNNSFQ